MRKFRAIDVGCGNCELSEDLLSDLFTEIDFLDINQDAIDKANNLLQRKGKKGEAIKHDMRTFQPVRQYNCVVMRYCIGYMNRTRASLFLQKMNHYLERSLLKYHRAAQSKSYIIIQDQILPSDREEFWYKSQKVRHQSTLEEIFKEANLNIFM